MITRYSDEELLIAVFVVTTQIVNSLDAKTHQRLRDNLLARRKQLASLTISESDDLEKLRRVLDMLEKFLSKDPSPSRLGF